ncbi:MAG TPA: hypothetical protein VN541_02440, partial [Tepidisphaeraceae bacterium]|nr:hypothetical protein [Tepidisphaeraceae bacterium]
MKFKSRPRARRMGLKGCSYISASCVAIEALEARQLLSASVVLTIGPQRFAENSTGTAQPVQADMYSYFADTVSGQPDLTFKAISDNTPLVDASMNGSLLTLAVAPSDSGYAHIQVVATDPNGATASQTFRVQVVASPGRSLDVPLSGTNKTFSYTQANHVTTT